MCTPGYSYYAATSRFPDGAAEQGVPEAQYERSVEYSKRLGGRERNDAEAALWCRKAAEQGHAGAQFDLGVMYEEGRGVERNVDEAVKWCCKAAEQDHSKAQHRLCAMYSEGSGGGEKDDEEATQRYGAWAHGEAQFDLARACEDGRLAHLSMDDETAAYWYRKAADGCHARASLRLGLLYMDGRGVAENKEKAFQRFREAAGRGDAMAQYNLGVMYANGWGTEVNDTQAVACYRQASNKNHAGAQRNLGVMYAEGRGVVRDDEEAAEWYRKAAKQGHPEAQFDLGQMYFNGLGVAKHLPKAFGWYLEAAKRGHAQAQYGVGQMYFSGQGVAQHLPTAFSWYLEAAKQGHSGAQLKLRDMYENGWGVERNEVQAAEWRDKAIGGRPRNSKRSTFTPPKLHKLERIEPLRQVPPVNPQLPRKQLEEDLAKATREKQEAEAARQSLEEEVTQLRAQLARIDEGKEQAEKKAAATTEPLIRATREKQEAEAARQLLEEEVTQLRAQLSRLAEEKAQAAAAIIAPTLIDVSDIALGDILGEGSFGKVYKAQWKGVEVAVKRFKRSVNAALLEREVNLMRQVGQHPNCVRLFGTCVGPGQQRMWLVMEAALGSMRDLMRQGTVQLSLAQVITLAADAAAALAFLHERGIAHRDVAARNVLISQSKRGLLSDFGLSRSLSHSTGGGTLNRGNCRWMAPEELIYTTNTSATLFKVSAQADVWSFGVFLWEVGTGRIQVPWDGLHEGQVLAALQGGHTLSSAGLNPLVQDLLARCWNRDPVQRPAMAEVHEVLRALAHRLQTDEQAAAAAAATAEALLAVMRAKAKPELTHEIPNPSAQPDGRTSTPTRTASRRSSAALPAPPAPAQGVAVKARTQRVVARRRSGLPQPVAVRENSLGTVMRNAVEQRRGAFAETLETDGEEDGDWCS